MPVYMIQAGENGPVKIGYSAEPDRRLMELQVAHWISLTLIRLLEGGEADEGVLHLRFNHLRLRGDWHSYSRELLGDVGLSDIPVGRLPDLPSLGFVATLPIGKRVAIARRRIGLSQRELAEMTGVSGSAVAQWETELGGIRSDRLIALATALHTTVGWLLSGDASPEPKDSAEAA